MGGIGSRLQFAHKNMGRQVVLLLRLDGRDMPLYCTPLAHCNGNYELADIDFIWGTTTPMMLIHKSIWGRSL